MGCGDERRRLAAGAKVNATDDQGRTPRSRAGDFGQASEIGDSLIEHGDSRRREEIVMAKTSTALAGLLSVVCFVAAGRADDDADLEKEVQKILAAKYAYPTSEGPGVAKGYEELFRRVGPAGIRELKKHKNPGVALRAAWEEVRLTVPKKELSGVPVDADALQRFLNVAKEQLPLLIPDWWQKALLSARANRRDNISFRLPKKMYEDAGAGLRAKPEIGVAKQAKGLLVTIGDESVLLREAIVEESASRDHLSALFGANDAFIALHRATGQGYPLHCINRKTDKVKWNATVWADGGGLIVYSGTHRHSVSIIAGKQQVLVFGCSGFLYMEAFNTDDGAALYRFSTRY
jgi:hypothetical protein